MTTSSRDVDSDNVDISSRPRDVDSDNVVDISRVGQAAQRT